MSLRSEKTIKKVQCHCDCSNHGYNKHVSALDFRAARRCVEETVRAARNEPSIIESVSLTAASGRVLAEDVAADRDFPPLARSVRDGYAVRAADVPAELRVIGEVRAGESFAGDGGPGEAVEIMTGAPFPRAPTPW